MGQKEQYQMDCVKAGLEEQHIILEHLKDKKEKKLFER